MNLKSIVSFIFVMAFSCSLFSAEPMPADAVKSLLTNNTTYCKNLQKNKEFTNYYRVCIDWGEEDGECCHPVFDQGNGTYHKFEEDEPKAEFRVIEGNPKNL